MATNEEIEAALSRYRSKANDLITNSGYGGFMNDQGGSMMLARANAYSDGWHGVVPAWLSLEIEDSKAADSRDYSEYERLRKKFGA